MRLHNGSELNQLWIFGLEMPIYLLGRWETTPRGSYVQFGGGPFVHFVLRSMMNNDGHDDVFKRVYTIDDVTGENARLLGDNYSGWGVLLTYEWWFGLQVNASFHYAISDILNYEHPLIVLRPPVQVQRGRGVQVVNHREI